MSLSEVILEMAEEMILEAEELKPCSEFAWTALRNYAKQLKVAVRASENASSSGGSAGQGAAFLHPDAQHFQMIEQARRELREQLRKAEGQESFDNRMIRCEGGPADGDMVPVPQDMPVGARTMIDGKVYVLSDGGALLWEKEKS